MLTHLSIHNWLAITDASIPLTKTVNIFTGMNGTGKSSIACAIEYLFTGRARGMEYKKDAVALIHEGSKQAEIIATFDTGTTIRRSRTASSETLRVAPPNNQPELKELPSPLKDWPAVALNPVIFFETLSPSERKAALAAILQKSIEAKAVEELLVARGIAQEHAATFAELVAKEGFAAAENEAILKRREAKRDIDALDAQSPSASLILAGQSYDLATIDADLVDAQLADLKTQRDALLEEKGAAKAPAKQSDGPSRSKIKDALANARAELNQLIQPEHTQDQLKAIIDKHEKAIEVERKRIREAESAITVSGAEEKLNIPDLEFVTCPVMGEGVKCPVSQADRNKTRKTFESRKRIGEKIIADSREAVRLATNNIEGLQRQILTAKGDMADVQEWEKRSMAARSAVTALEGALATASDEPEQPELAVTRDFDAEIEEIDERISVGTTLLQKITQFKADSLRSANAATRLEELTARVLLYNTLAINLAPGAVPVDLIYDLLQQFRNYLKAASAIFGADIDLSGTDFLPLFNRRMYRLCSESEQWRAQVAFQEAIAHFAEVPYLVIDRADILDRELKGALAQFLVTVAPSYDRIFVFATESDVPPQRSDHPDVALWQVANGSVKPV